MKYVVLAASLLLLPPAAQAAESCAGPIAAPFAQTFAQNWIAAWNSHDLDRILADHAPDFEMRSPGIVTVAHEPSGILKGRDKVRAYWDAALKAQPNLRFELLGVYAGAGSIAIQYQSVGRYPVVEVVEFDAACQMVRGSALRGR